MLIDSVMKIQDQSHLVNYAKYYFDLEASKPDFSAYFIELTRDVARFYIYGPLLQNLKWSSILNLGRFLCQLTETNKFDEGLLKMYLGKIRIRAIDCNVLMQKPGNVDFAKFILELAKDYPKLVIKGVNIANFDLIYRQMEESSEEFRNIGKKIYHLFNQTLNFKYSVDNILPSFKQRMNDLIETGSVKSKVEIDDDVSCGTFFFEEATSKPFQRAAAFAKDMKKWQKMDKDPDPHSMIKRTISTILEHVEYSFFSQFDTTPIDAKLAVGITKFLTELYMVGLETSHQYIEITEKVMNVALENPTVCHLMCFRNFLETYEEHNDDIPDDFYSKVHSSRVKLIEFGLMKVKMNHEVWEDLDLIKTVEMTTLKW